MTPALGLWGSEPLFLEQPTPGRCLVLRTPAADALWVSSWPYTRYVKHAWAGAGLCSLFRNESALLSSLLIEEAVAATCWTWGQPPDLGMITLVDLAKVRHKRDPGRCYRKAGWRPVGFTKSGHLVLPILPEEMPAPEPASGSQLSLFASLEAILC